MGESSGLSLPCLPPCRIWSAVRARSFLVDKLDEPGEFVGINAGQVEPNRLGIPRELTCDGGFRIGGGARVPGTLPAQ
jgi:hypothetical protein